MDIDRSLHSFQNCLTRCKDSFYISSCGSSSFNEHILDISEKYEKNFQKPASKLVFSQVITQQINSRSARSSSRFLITVENTRNIKKTSLANDINHLTPTQLCVQHLMVTYNSLVSLKEEPYDIRPVSLLYSVTTFQLKWRKAYAKIYPLCITGQNMREPTLYLKKHFIIALRENLKKPISKPASTN